MREVVELNLEALLTEKQRRILELLRERGALRVTDVAELLGMSKPLASYHLHRLASAELVEAVRNTEDNRSVLYRAVSSPEAIAHSGTTVHVCVTCGTFYSSRPPGCEVCSSRRFLEVV